MEDTVDGAEVSQMLVAPAGFAVGRAIGVPIVALEVGSAPARSARAFDDIPSVVRALLIGYDEA